ncbi:hypothetical protein KFK09_022190 [Dendrobium nobile]|uniref:Uncharacterized protein n=1 Tax=Dendrobium nobile TaxID=94219 RepID=A0A8T3AI69_DENNO|nr:hypothetical protein KFK09_022190 [Dendrobium nobile]
MIRALSHQNFSIGFISRRRFSTDSILSFYDYNLKKNIKKGDKKLKGIACYFLSNSSSVFKRRR